MLDTYYVPRTNGRKAAKEKRSQTLHKSESLLKMKYNTEIG